MPKVTLHPTLRGLSGKMGNVVFRTNKRTGTTSMSRLPDMSNVKWSPAQKSHRQRFKEAVAYAKTIKAQPQVWAVYEALARKTRKRAWDLAVLDHYHGSGLLDMK